MISVILTTFDRCDTFLPKAIKSVVDQSYKDWELIIVDDCSTDETTKVVESYPDERIQYIRLPENFGSDTHPKNVGFEASNGEYVLFLDDDVQLRKHALRTLVRSMPKYDVVYGDMWIEPMGEAGIAHDFDRQFLMLRNYIDTSSALMKRECLQYIGGWDETLPKFVDWNVWVRMAKAGYNFKRIPKFTFNYYIHKKTKSQRVVTEMYHHPQLGTLFVPTFSPTGCKIRLPYLGEIKEPKVAIYTIHYNRPEYSKETAIEMFDTAGYPFDWYCWDNSIDDKTFQELDKLPMYFYGTEGVNLGITEASNRLLSEIMVTNKNYDIVIKIDNDVEFLTNNWLNDVVEMWKTNHMLYISPYVEGLRDNPGGALRKGYGKIGNEFIEVTNHIGGIFAAISMKAYKEFRFTDKKLHGNQDLETSAYFREHGYMPCYYPKHIICHRDGTAGQHLKHGDYFKERDEKNTAK